jgi:hypothetical protein
MADPAIVQSRSVQADLAGSVALAFTSNVTSGNTIAVGGGAWTQTFGSSDCTDSQTNSYTLRAGPIGNASGATAAQYSAHNVAAGATTVTLNPSGASEDVSIVIVEISGVDNSSPVVTTQTNTATSGTHSSGSIDTTGAYNSFILCIDANEGSTTAIGTITGGFTLDQSQTSGANVPIASFYRVGAAATTYTMTVVWAAALYAVASVAYKATDQTPPPTPTRLYFPAATTTSVTPGFAGWTASAEAVRRQLVFTKGSSAIGAGSTINLTSGAGNTALDRQYVSEPLDPGIAFDTTWTVQCQLMVREFATTDNVDRYYLCIKVYSQDGATLRATLLALGNYGPTLELINNATMRNKTVADGDALTGSYTTVANDRLVVEIGPGMSGTGTTPQAASKWGENATDLPVNETQTTDGAGWIEFSKEIYLAGTGGRTGTLSKTLGALTLSSAGTLPITGAATPTLGAATLVAAGAVPVTGTAAATLGALTVSSAGDVANAAVTGSLSQTLGALTSTSEGAVAVAGTLAQTLGDLTASGAGAASVEGTAAPTLDALTAVSAGTVSVEGTSAVTLDALTLSAAGAVPVTGSVAATLGALTVVAVGPYVSDTLLQKVQLAVATGWRNLGELTNDAFREASILYNTDDSLFYVFNTEQDGNPPPYASWNITTSQTGNPTIITLDGPHGFALGTRQYAVTISGCDVAAINGIKFVTAPSANQLSLSINTTVQATTGFVERNVTTAMVGMRKAATLEGIVSASGSNYVSRVMSGQWYSSVVKTGEGASSVWYAHGWGSSTTTTRRQFPGATPTAVNQFGSVATINVTVGDISLLPVQVGGYWYAVGLKSGDDNEHVLYRNSDITVASGWAQVGGDIWGTGEPSWANGPKPDPNLAYYDGQAYLMFTAGPVSGEWSTGIVRIDLPTATVSGDVLMLLQYGLYEEWQDGAILSDVQLVVGGDGVPHLVAFVNPGTYSPSGTYAWGALDLLPVPGYGTTTATLGALTVVSEGTVSSADAATGTLDQTLGSLTATSAGTVSVEGSATPTLGTLTSTATGAVSVDGTSSPTLDALTLSAAGGVAVAGTSAVTLDALTASSAGVVPVTGALSATLGALTVTSEGGTGLTGSVAATLGALTASAAGAVQVAGTLAAGTLDALTVSAVGVVPLTGTLSTTLDALAASSTGTVPLTGSTSQTLGALTVSATGAVGEPPVVGELARTLGALTVTSAGTVVVEGAAAPTLDALTVVASGEVAVGGTLSQTLGAVVLAAAGTLPITGTSARTLGALTSSSAGTVAWPGATGTLARTLGPLTLVAAATTVTSFPGTATATHGIVGSATATHGVMSGAAGATSGLVGSAAATWRDPD